MTLDPAVASSARVWTYWLGGRDHYAVDRAVGDMVTAMLPSIVDVATQSRAFHGRVVRHLVEDAGVRQFLDVGIGLPSSDSTHELAQSADPSCRVVYVDNDPLVLVRARALLTSTPQGACGYVDADVREPEVILAEAAKTLDLQRPVALLMLGVLGSIADHTRARRVVQRLLDALPPGSYLALNDGTHDLRPEASVAAARLRTDAGAPYHLRTRAEIADFFDGLQLLSPGVVSPSRWRAAADGVDGAGLPEAVDAFCGVARKP
ncbi:SAM-dependent methyltransferase [Pseudonocardia kunmingensis]|uniref:S-adenosyl methyltransferase n=1 Tax=Pseudonocardia kunmingensis TaxID=630975 RepID=A0A543DQY3_9PSEU|nr:SAM-dependent methyltransferase [Pseudonocardia kunmingensis]TQM11736.1 S-adenosyl methyltransferase [Pseudonocardia kunmingensis]